MKETGPDRNRQPHIIEKRDNAGHLLFKTICDLVHGEAFPWKMTSNGPQTRTAIKPLIRCATRGGKWRQRLDQEGEEQI
jgi:hypothetical protein